MGCKVTSSLSPADNRLNRGLLPISGKAKKAAHINEGLGEIEPHWSILAGRVVIWECVMKIVVALTNGCHADEQALDGLDARVVRLVTKHMGD